MLAIMAFYAENYKKSEKIFYLFVWKLFTKCFFSSNIKSRRRKKERKGDNMKSKANELSPAAYVFDGKLPLKQAIPLGLQHVLAMFVGNLTPLLIITGACGIGNSGEYAGIQVALLQNAMIIAGIVTLIQLFAIGPIGGKVCARFIACNLGRL